MKNLVRFGLGGRQGNGDQMFSWIHIEDLFNVITYFGLHDNLEGIFNTAAPNPVKNKILMQLLRKNMGVLFGLPMPVWLLKMGAVLIKTETELILKSRWVIPERLLQSGFKFRYPTLDEALDNILK